ncbi:ADP-ribose pyrophosphatase [Methylomarinovum caldicuralii]|uniref:ADP-ribose pyrophosphatase n=1 Tax=Methylomarinovum caldicuralii TaxID=438856 RepID=A0AAU9BYW1_9GAMM|nr:NUDIX domain-containing protein [Methylomarinovum caldicuralii]BCX81272.1 ADP-ribose pyrophosphatase [Methylomarinovum caldicuralii]
MRYEYEILEEEVAYRGFFNLLRLKLRHRLFRGGWSRVLVRELFQRGNCVAVLPYDPRRDEVLLVEQFRVGPLKNGDPAWMLEIVAGAIEPGETPEAVAWRELQEECGCRARAMTRITEFYTSPGGSSEKITLFWADVEAAQAGGIHGLSCEDEDIRVHVLPFEAAYAKVEDGEIDSAIPILALQWLALHRERLRALSSPPEDRP